MLAIIWPLRGAYGRTTNVSRSGTRRISPTGPYVASGARKSRLVNDCMPFTSPIPLVIRRASCPTWVLLPRITPPLSQYRKRTSWRPCSSACLTISSGVIDWSPPVLRGGDLLGHDLGAERELAALDRDHRHAFLGHMGIGRERDRAGNSLEVLRAFDRRLDGRRIRAAGPFHRVREQIDGVVAEGRERVLRVVPVFGLVVGDD